MKTWLKWVIIVVTGALAYGLTYASSLYPSWAQILGGLNVTVVLICGKLTGFPKSDEVK